MIASLSLPRIMRVGRGAVDELGDVITGLGVSRPLLVTDAFLVGTGAAESLVATLKDAGLHPLQFSDTVPDPTTDSLTSGLKALRDHRADSVIGFGGGSPMDSAKALALLGAQGGRMRDYKAPRVNLGPALPVVAVPTTAGSGSEATQFTVITDSATDEKMLCLGLAFLPLAAVVDAAPADRRHRYRRAHPRRRGIREPQGQPLLRQPRTQRVWRHRPPSAPGLRRRLGRTGPRGHDARRDPGLHRVLELQRGPRARHEPPHRRPLPRRPRPVERHAVPRGDRLLRARGAQPVRRLRPRAGSRDHHGQRRRGRRQARRRTPHPVPRRGRTHAPRLRHRPGHLEPPDAPHGRAGAGFRLTANNPAVPTADQIQDCYSRIYA